MPTTVLAAQVAAGVYKDIYFGMNLRSIPGATYPIGENFSNLPMPADSPYRCGWWYRKQFDVPAADAGETFSLQFDGINYSADIWVNGKRIADQSQVRGAYRTYEFDISRPFTPAQRTSSRSRCFRPTEKSLAINWVDWSPMPPDKEHGTLVERYAWLRAARSRCGIRQCSLTSRTTRLQTALLTVTADLRNESSRAIQGEAVADVAGRHLVAAGQHSGWRDRHRYTFARNNYPQLKLSHPRVWWPADYGDQPLENATVRFVANDRTSDSEQVRFGVREITSEFTARGHRLFRINGKPILIRGGGWTPDMMLRNSHDRLVQQFDLVRDLHLNTIRLEGKMESDDFFRLADERGVLVMAGWCCCDYWEKWTEWSADDMHIAAASLESQLLRMRSHPSVLGLDVRQRQSAARPRSNADTAR